ncbi:hypothetical protein HFN60_22950 [Rhizobium leguminosarum]|uniref:hypothetical protein n=1 Tax=Rhizobium leguminosarum TaxID=384 RepID=UPI001440E720|nr:hypothetical protein [Rhizobium leguminosarum]MBY5818475.1 hypothetical protein [Rhizobium leguminosarum]NKK97199.1 hypothetical protein [Rhizobium leguminosarum bv. viciae]
MSILDEIFPAAEISEKLPDAQVSVLGVKDLPEIIRLKGMTMFEMGLTTWHAAMISGQFEVSPNSLGDLVDRGEPNLLKYVSRALNRKVVFDISYRYATVPGAATMEPKMQVLVAHLFPNRLHIADVQLLDPRKPKKNSQLNDDQSHESLRLFGVLIANAERVAKEVQAEQITLTAANRRLVTTFQKYGFKVEDSGMARQAMAFDAGIPMERTI